MDYLMAKEKAVKYIGLTKKTEAEVTRKLEKLLVDDEVINKVIEDLTSIGYIDDEAYATLYIKQCISEGKKSKFEIAQRLLQKGIKEGIIENSLDNIPDEYEENLKEKIIKIKSKVMDEEKLKLYLKRRGLLEDDWE